MSLLIGICASYERCKEVKEAGFDYIELPLNKVALYSNEEFEKVKSSLRETSLTSPTMSLLLPKSLCVIGDSYNEAELINYLDVAFKRMKELDSSIVVFGSGKSRYILSGVSYITAFNQLVEVTKLIVEKAREYNITIVIEALNRDETNLINNLTEAALLSSLSGASLLVDSFHLNKEGEDINHISLCSPFKHAHIATLDGRRVPTEKSDEVVSFISALKRSGYTGRLSLEGKYDDLIRECSTSIRMLKEVWQEA